MSTSVCRGGDAGAVTGKPKTAARQAATRQAAERAGRRAEAWAALWLSLRGYRILARRMRTPASEVDMVALHRGALVVVEVKARRSWAAAEDGIGWGDRAKLGRAAEWLSHRRWGVDQWGHPREVRLDAVYVCGWRVRVVQGAWREGD